jgi:phage terminase small subunit
MWNELKPQVDSLRIYTRSSETAFRSLVAAAAMTRHRADYSFREFLDALRITSSLLSRFGLDPASRSKVSVVETGKDEAADFMFDGAPQLTAVAGGKK